MKQTILTGIFAFLLTMAIKAQIIIIPIGILTGTTGMPEHGFLPGKKFKFYPTINKFDFTGLKLRVEIYDNRERLKLTQVKCSDVEFTNTSEFNNPNCIYKVGQYADTLLRKTGAIIDSASTDTLQLWLEGIDARLIGFGSVRVHGLCQMKIKYGTIVKTYCIDITDLDKHSPLSRYAFVTRKTATRVMASAAIREIIEQFFIDLNSYRQ